MTDWLSRMFVKNFGRVNDPDVRVAYGLLASVVCIVCNVVLCLAKGVIGLAAGSVSIVADAVNNLSDASSNMVALAGFKLASRPADAAHPYGHGRYEYLAGLVVSVLVTAVGIELVRSGIERILAPEPVDFSLALVVVMLLSIAVKAWMMSFNRTIGRRIESETLEATAVDSHNDVITTGAVLVCAVVSRFTGVELDGWVGLAVGLFVLASGLGLVRETVGTLLGQAPSPELVEHIREKILGYPGVLGTHDLMIHDYGPGRKFASAHVEMAAEADPLETHDLIDNIEQDFLREDGLVMTIHYDPIVTNDPGLHDLRNWLEARAEGLAPGVSVHDVRRVSGPTHANVIFDVVRPASCALNPDELRERLSAVVAERYPEAACSITIDESYLSVV